MSRAFVVRAVEWQAASAALAAVRRQVFVIEQCVPEDMEWDGLDASCVHALASAADGSAIGTGRLTPDGRIGRMAVLADWRGCGVGAALLAVLIEAARALGMRALHLHAQTHAVAFYERFGFAVHGPAFDEAGIPHREMHLAR